MAGVRPVVCAMTPWYVAGVTVRPSAGHRQATSVPGGTWIAGGWNRRSLATTSVTPVTGAASAAERAEPPWHPPDVIVSTSTSRPTRAMPEPDRTSSDARVAGAGGADRDEDDDEHQADGRQGQLDDADDAGPPRLLQAGQATA